MVLDWETALARVGGDTDLLAEIAEIFVLEYPNLLADLSRAVQAADPSGVERAAHTLKGSVATFGAEPAVQAALKLEMAGRKQDLAGATGVLSELETLLATLHSELHAL